jgi:hypothetical protein
MVAEVQFEKRMEGHCVVVVLVAIQEAFYRENITRRCSSALADSEILVSTESLARQPAPGAGFEKNSVEIGWSSTIWSSLHAPPSLSNNI